VTALSLLYEEKEKGILPNRQEKTKLKKGGENEGKVILKKE